MMATWILDSLEEIVMKYDPSIITVTQFLFE